MLATNMVLRQNDEQEPRYLRILYLDQTIIVTIDIFDPHALPHYQKYNDLMDAITQNDIIVERNSIAQPIPVLEPDKHSMTIKHYEAAQERYTKAIERRDRAWEIIEPLVATTDIFDSKKRGQLIQKRCQETNTTHKEVYEFLRRYWQGGMLKNTLLPRFYKSGGKGQKREPKDAKRGRPNVSVATITPHKGINITNDISNIFHKGMKTFYNDPNKLTLRQTYFKIMDRWFSTTELVNEQPKRVLLPAHERPTFGQFYYWYQTSYNSLMSLKKREPRAYQNAIRSFPQNTTLGIFGPGSEYQVDATIADVFLVNSINPQWSVGRPVLYTVKDVFSRMIVGVAVLLEGPSWLGAMITLENATTDKVAYCRRFGIEITEDMWPCHYLPVKLLADRGEFEGYNADALSEGLNIQVSNTAPYRADWKSIVERDFGLTNERVIKGLPGEVKRRERGDKDYRLDACLTLEDFTTIIIRRILQYNHTHYLQDYPRTVAMIQANLEPYPIELWRWGIQFNSGSLRTLPPDIIRQHLLYQDSASVTPKGISFKKLKYTCQSAKDEYWMHRAKEDGTWTVTIFYDPRCTDTIFLRHKNGVMEPCVLLNATNAMVNRSFYELADLALQRSRAQFHRRTRDQQAIVDLNRQVEDIVTVAQKRKREATKRIPALSKSARIKRIRPQRREERDRERHAGAWFTKPRTKIASPQDETQEIHQTAMPADAKPVVDDSFFRNLRKKGGNDSHG